MTDKCPVWVKTGEAVKSLTMYEPRGGEGRNTECDLWRMCLSLTSHGEDDAYMDLGSRRIQHSLNQRGCHDEGAQIDDRVGYSIPPSGVWR